MVVIMRKKYFQFQTPPLIKSHFLFYRPPKEWMTIWDPIANECLYG